MILLSANKSSPIRCFSQLSLFHSCYQSFIPPKSQLQQMIWKTEWQTWWDFVGMKLLFVKFPFGTEMRMSQQNHEGGWSGIGMATVGIHPNDFDLYPNKIPPGRVVQNCQIWISFDNTFHSDVFNDQNGQNVLMISLPSKSFEMNLELLIFNEIP